MASSPPQPYFIGYRERLLLVAGLALIVLLAWLYLFGLAGSMSMGGMDDMDAMSPSLAYGRAELLSLFLMWTVMMVAMMLPSASPMILVFLSLNKRRSDSGGAMVPVWIFALGYIAVWMGFSVLATSVQWGLREASVLSEGMLLTNSLISGAILVLAGLFQLSPLKHRCLAVCRSPLSFLLSKWRPHRFGALRMGVEHGIYCVGCCWLLMALLFVAGVMNLFWVMVIAAFVLIEKIFAWGEMVGRVAGVLLICLGSWLLFIA